MKNIFLLSKESQFFFQIRLYICGDVKSHTVKRLAVTTSLPPFNGFVWWCLVAETPIVQYIMIRVFVQGCFVQSAWRPFTHLFAKWSLVHWMTHNWISIVRHHVYVQINLWLKVICRLKESPLARIYIHRYYYFIGDASPFINKMNDELHQQQMYV